MVRMQEGVDRVRANTAPDVNRAIDKHTEENVHMFSSQPRAVLDARIEELDREWDVERILETMASTFTLIGLGLGVFVNTWWLLLPVFVQTFFFLHAVQGWCPPLPVIRRIGRRTRKEIDAEKFAMKALRGDFDGLSRATNRLELVQHILEAVKTYCLREQIPTMTQDNYRRPIIR